MKETIVLVPGVIAQAHGLSWEYFKNIPSYLESNDDVDVHVIDLPPWGTIEKRAPIIKEYVQKNFPDKKVHVIAHSKGGVEVRALLEKGEINDCVKSFTSISCPYKGSMVATIFYYLFFPLIIIPLFRDFILTLKELRSGNYQKMWTKDYSEYNFPCHYVNSIIPTPLILNTYPLFWFTNSLLNIFEGKNDGFVSTSSSQFGELIQTYPSDHIGMIGHFGNRPFNYLDVYKEIFAKIVLNL